MIFDAYCYFRMRTFHHHPKISTSYDEFKERWIQYLSLLAITNERHIRIITEGALLGTLLDTTYLSSLAIVSDGAGQFNVLHHGFAEYMLSDWSICLFR